MLFAVDNQRQLKQHTARTNMSLQCITSICFPSRSHCWRAYMLSVLLYIPSPSLRSWRCASANVVDNFYRRLVIGYWQWDIENDNFNNILRGPTCPCDV